MLYSSLNGRTKSNVLDMYIRGEMRIYMADSRGKVEGRGYSEYCDVNGRTGLKNASEKGV